MRLIDDQTFETVDVLPLHRHEMACSCTSLTLADDPNPYYVVGTAYAIPDEQEPTKVQRQALCCLLTANLAVLVVYAYNLTQLKHGSH